MQRLLLGDAAHQMPPFGGQGLCSGIRDAHNLCWKLYQVLEGYSSDSLFDTYGQERKPHVQEMMQRAIRFGAIAQTQNPIIARLRNFVFRVLHLIPIVSKKLKDVRVPLPPIKTGILANTIDPSQSTAGQLFVQAEIATSIREKIPLDDILGHHFAIVSFNQNLTSLISDEAEAFWNNRNTQFVNVISAHCAELETTNSTTTSGKITVVDIHDQLRIWFSQQRGNVAIIRPDRYVYGVYRPEEMEAATVKLHTFL